MGRTYNIEPSYPGLDSVFPTSMWPVGQIIREEFEVHVLAEYPSLTYAMNVGVKEGDRYLQPAGAGIPSDKKRYVGGGIVDIRPSQLPAPLSQPPKPQVAISAGSGDVNLVGYDLDIASDGIAVTTYYQKTVETGRDYDLSLRLRNEFN
ncbi:MAG: hypothetical protein M1546_05750, partial [Chloroflexi bacterium]|nr:hypothetical protein [Chloroflexota bacterium]